ncbi:hypothetical protein MLD38_010754 [Melastoma candidum]|uniref:Uncharacterized protein n=1 Tax=Melastoma candidum TaxID=119954 RepID=A0ACB9R2P9_9MYRT|nr:hypothetical protein MLD38_010754 [Melastoma candidum]
MNSGQLAGAETEEGGDGPTGVGSLPRLKERLWVLVRRMVDGDGDGEEDDGCCLEDIDEAIQVLCVLAGSIEEKKCPEELTCPISKAPMMDPVVLESGQTYDRMHVERLLREGQRKCPKTQQVLFDTTFVIPNHLVRRLIAGWCTDQGIEIPMPVEDEASVNVSDAIGTLTSDVPQLELLLKKMDASSGDCKEAAKQLRKLTECSGPLVKGSPDTIRRLFGLFPLPVSVISEPDFQEDVVAILFNVIIHASSKKLVEESPSVISVLVDALYTGTATTKNNAAAALSELSNLNTSMKLMIAEAGALKPLVIILSEGNLSAISNSVSAIYNLCTVIEKIENRRKAVHAGAIKWICRRMSERVLMDDFLGLLTLLSSDNDTIDEMKELKAVPLLLNVLRETSNERNKEHCVAILHKMCFSDRTMRREIRRDEKVNGTLWEVAKSGNARARRKANGILDRIWTDISTPDTRSA